MKRLEEHGARGGFTLLEMMLAMAVLLIGLTAVLGMLTFGAALTRTAALRTSASGTIEAVVADLEETLFPLDDEGEAGEPREIVERAVLGAPGVVYSAKATPNPDLPDEYRVDVEVSWKTAGTTRKHTFQTLLLREVPFGERMRRLFVERRSRGAAESKP